MLLQPGQVTQHQQFESQGGGQVEPAKPKVDPQIGMPRQPGRGTQHQRLENPGSGQSCLDATFEGLYAGYGCCKR